MTEKLFRYTIAFVVIAVPVLALPVLTFSPFLTILVWIIATSLLLLLVWNFFRPGFLPRVRFLLFPLEREWLVDFYDYVARALRAGYPLDEAIENHVHDVGPYWFRRRIGEVLVRLHSGEPFSKAGSDYPELFPAHDRGIIETGEQTDHLAEAFEYLAGSQRSREFRHLPLFLLFMEAIVCLGVLMFIFIIVVPKFREIYDQMGAELPFLTESILAWSEHAEKGWPWVLVAILGLILITGRFFKGTRLAKSGFAFFPMLSNVYWAMPLSRFSFAMAHLLRAQAPVHEAAAKSAIVSSNPLFLEGSSRMVESLANGNSFATALENIEHLPPSYLWFIRSATERERLEETLLLLAETYKTEFGRTTSALSAILFPLLMLVFGAMVGIAALALYLPLFNIGHFIGL